MEGSLSVSPQSFKSFGELLRFLRERVDLSQKELALQVGYHYSYMSRIEKNQRTPDPTTLAARFVPALYLDEEPEWTARLLELAGAPVSKAPPQALSSNLRTGASDAPPTALPIFDLSASNLPTVLTPILGRDDEVVELINLLNRNEVRLVTVIGPPGVGKTRLAAHVAAQIAGQFAHGPLFVDLTTVADVEAFLPAIAQALGIRETSDMPLIKNIIASLRQRNLLLVLDNFEQVIDASPNILPILSNAPSVKILSTSREALHISGEYEFPLVPLSLPESTVDAPQRITDGEQQFNDLSHFAAVQLFVQRAQAVQPRFELTAENISNIVEICRRLDGLPLAIELAAARVKTLAPQAMLEQLDHRLDWLTRGSRDANEWRQTLRGTLEWSYNLLAEPERILLRRLSVFSDGWTLRAAEAICADPPELDSPQILRREDVLDLLIKLVDKSVVITEEAQQTRYRLFETMREFGREKLVQANELSQTLNRHLAFFAEFAEESESHLDGTDQAAWMAAAGKEHNNLRAAIDYSLTPDADLNYGLRTCAALSLFWLERNHYHEGIERLKIMIQRAVSPEHSDVHAKMLYRCAAIYMQIAEFATAYNLCQQSIDISRGLDNKRLLASALYYLGEICIDIQNYAQAKIVLEESISICWVNHFPTQLNIALTDLGRVLFEQGEKNQALATLNEALTIAERIDDTWGMIHATDTLGMVHRYAGKQDIAIDYFQRSLQYSRAIGDRLGEGVSLSNLSILYNLKEDYQTAGHIAEQAFIAFQTIGDELEQPFPLRMMGYSAIQAGNTIRARALIFASLKANHELEHIPGQLACLVALGTCELVEGNALKAIHLAALVENRMNAESFSFIEPDTIALNKLFQAARKKLGEKSYDQALINGRMLVMEEMVAAELNARS